MIIKIKNWQSTQLGVKYLTQKAELGQGELILSNIYQQPDESLHQAMQNIVDIAADQRKRPLKEAYKHIIFSFAPTDRILSDGELKTLLQESIADLGYEQNPQFSVIHRDQEHLHVHTVVSRYYEDDNGLWQVTSDANERVKASKIRLSVEEQFDLVKTARVASRDSLNQDEFHAKKSARKLLRSQVREAVFNAVKGKPSLQTLAERLERKGIRMVPNVNSGGVVGTSFVLDDTSFKGSELGKAYGWQQLQKRLSQTTLEPETIRHLVEGKSIQRALSKPDLALLLSVDNKSTQAFKEALAAGADLRSLPRDERRLLTPEQRQVATEHLKRLQAQFARLRASKSAARRADRAIDDLLHELQQDVPIQDQLSPDGRLISLG